MEASFDELLQWLAAAPNAVVYLTLALAAALENIVPPIPADVVVFLGGVLAGQGIVDPWVVFFAVWGANVATALLVYGIGRRYGQVFFEGRWGGLILRPHQLAQLDAFYTRHGAGVIFISRFLPMFRAVVPVFAGVSGLGVLRTAWPMAAASGLWYGLIVYLGTAAGRNWREILVHLSDAGRWLWILAIGAAAFVGWWWWKSR